MSLQAADKKGYSPLNRFQDNMEGISTISEIAEGPRRKTRVKKTAGVVIAGGGQKRVYPLNRFQAKMGGGAVSENEEGSCRKTRVFVFFLSANYSSCYIHRARINDRLLAANCPLLEPNGDRSRKRRDPTSLHKRSRQLQASPQLLPERQ